MCGGYHRPKASQARKGAMTTEISEHADAGERAVGHHVFLSQRTSVPPSVAAALTVSC
jgi:hypothetical protein